MIALQCLYSGVPGILQVSSGDRDGHERQIHVLYWLRSTGIRRTTVVTAF